MEHFSAIRRGGAEGMMVVIRWIAIVFASAQITTFYRPFPGRAQEFAWALVAAFAVAAVALTSLWWRQRNREFWTGDRSIVGLVALAADTAFAVGLTWVFAFDPDTAIFVVGYVVAVEGAYRFGMRGALGTMALFGACYVAREVWAVGVYGSPLYVESITYRVGIGFLIAGVAGSMAERARREHDRLQLALLAERDAATALRSLDELRSTFLTAVSHELRTPLTSILGFSMTVRDFSAGLGAESRMMLDHVVEESQRLEQLLEDLLDIERMGRGSVAIERSRVDVAQIARRCVNRAREASGRRLVVGREATMGVVDEAKVERVIDNLVGNAIKYSPDESVVEVHVERVSDGVLLRVDDEGPGVPASLRGTIFAPFERGEITSQHKPGTGIGLSLVDRFARLHGGRAWVEERRNGRAAGASFRVFLPDGPEGEEAVTVMHQPWGGAPTADRR